MLYFVLAALAIVVGGLLLWGRASNRNKAQQLKTADHRSIGELQEMSKEIAAELGPGSYNEQVELRGNIECAAPLISELSESPCVHYRMSIERKYEEQYEHYDQQNDRTELRTRKGSESVASNTRSCPFMLRDDTGAVRVLSDGASIDTEQVLSAFEPEGSMIGGGQLTFGRFSMGIGAGWGTGRRTLGYELKEWALPVGRNVYVLGEVNDEEGELRVSKPHDRANKFIISPKSKQALIQAAEGAVKGFTVGAVIAFVAGAGLFVGGLISLIAR